jgi:predicted transposase YbfD/YdcC
MIQKKFNIQEAVKCIRDFRQIGKTKHLLSDVVLTGLFTLVTNGHDYADMVIFAKTHGKKLKKYLKYPNGIPSHDTFERVFSTIAPNHFINLLISYSQCFMDTLAEKQINIDGKKLRGVSPKSKGNSGLYLLSAWVSENRLCVGQQKVEDKSNEITAIPVLLSALDITSAIVSIDAIGCQTEIVNQICEQQGEYLISLKGNQGSLLQDVESAFQLDDKLIETTDWIIEDNASRKESRRCAILDATKVLPKEQIAKWRNLSTLVRVESIRAGVKEERFYISSEKNLGNINKPLYFNKLVRAHWSIENHLHWHLDVTFKEDKSRARNKYAPQNLAILRKLALQLIQNAKAHFKLSMAKIRYELALNIDSLRDLLQFSCV